MDAESAFRRQIAMLYGQTHPFPLTTLAMLFGGKAFLQENSALSSVGNQWLIERKPTATGSPGMERGLDESAAPLSLDASLARSSSCPFVDGGGGTDLRGDAYAGSNVPVPDPDPMDCEGAGGIDLQNAFSAAGAAFCLGDPGAVRA